MLSNRNIKRKILHFRVNNSILDIPGKKSQRSGVEFNITGSMRLEWFFRSMILDILISGECNGKKILKKYVYLPHTVFTQVQVVSRHINVLVNTQI